MGFWLCPAHLTHTFLLLRVGVGGGFGFGSFLQLHIPSRLFLNPSDTPQIPPEFCRQRGGVEQGLG